MSAPGKNSFFAEFLRDRNVAAVSPSSRFLMRRLLRTIGPLGAARTVIELGPGDGVAMAALLPHLAPDARYLAIERNPNFAANLTGRMHGDGRVTILEGSAQQLAALAPGAGIAPGTADAIIASIPFTYLSPAERRALLADARRLLRPGGSFVIFHQYTPLMAPYVRAEFGADRTEFEPLNVFPCFVMSATAPR